MRKVARERILGEPVKVNHNLIALFLFDISVSIPEYIRGPKSKVHLASLQASRNLGIEAVFVELERGSHLEP